MFFGENTLVIEIRDLDISQSHPTVPKQVINVLFLYFRYASQVRFLSTTHHFIVSALANKMLLTLFIKIP